MVGVEIAKHQRRQGRGRYRSYLEFKGYADGGYLCCKEDDTRALTRQRTVYSVEV